MWYIIQRKSDITNRSISECSIMSTTSVWICYIVYCSVLLKKSLKVAKLTSLFVACFLGWWNGSSGELWSEEAGRGETTAEHLGACKLALSGAFTTRAQCCCRVSHGVHCKEKTHDGVIYDALLWTHSVFVIQLYVSYFLMQWLNFP